MTERPLSTGIMHGPFPDAPEPLKDENLLSQVVDNDGEALTDERIFYINSVTYDNWAIENRIEALHVDAHEGRMSEDAACWLIDKVLSPQFVDLSPRDDGK